MKQNTCPPDIRIRRASRFFVRRLSIPTLNAELSDFSYLFNLWNHVNIHRPKEIVFEFSRCRFLRPNAVAFLGGLARYLQGNGVFFTFDETSISPPVWMNLAQNGFLSAFGMHSCSWDGNSVPYREDHHKNTFGLVDYLQSKWLGKGWVRMSPRLQAEIIGTTWEIYENAFEHSQSVGVFSCGQRYPNRNELELTVVDFGVGIPSNVRRFHQNPSIPAPNALKWAFQRGKTTRPGRSGGIGLDRLQSFIRANQGKLEIFSHDGYAVFDGNGATYRQHWTFFNGTLVHITISCDDSYYCFQSEVLPNPLF